MATVLSYAALTRSCAGDSKASHPLHHPKSHGLNEDIVKTPESLRIGGLPAKWQFFPCFPIPLETIHRAIPIGKGRLLGGLLCLRLPVEPVARGLLGDRGRVSCLQMGLSVLGDTQMNVCFFGSLQHTKLKIGSPQTKAHPHDTKQSQSIEAFPWQVKLRVRV